MMKNKSTSKILMKSGITRCFAPVHTSSMKISTSILTVTAGLLLSSHAAVTVNGSTAGTLVSNGLTTAAVYTTTTDGFNERNVHGNRLNTQTFQVASTFTLDAVYLEYQAPGGGTYADGDFTLSIYNVADVNAATLTLGSSVVSATFTSNATTRAAAGFTTSDSATSLLKFDFTGIDEVPLAATSGTAGYALQFTTTTGSGVVFNWQRSGNDLYPGGSSYETGSINSGLDYALALTAIPEPSAMALFGFSGVALLARRRRK
jgi:hypothetical protein